MLSNSLPNCRLLRFYLSFVQDFYVSFLFVFLKFKHTAELSPFKIICGLLFTFSSTAEMTLFFDYVYCRNVALPNCRTAEMSSAEMTHCRDDALPKCRATNFKTMDIRKSAKVGPHLSSANVGPHKSVLFPCRTKSLPKSVLVLFPYLLVWTLYLVRTY